MREECEVWINNNPDHTAVADVNKQSIVAEIEKSTGSTIADTGERATGCVGEYKERQ